MDHIIPLAPPSTELDHFLQGKITYLLRGGMGKKAPYGKIKLGDSLYFAEGNEIKAAATVGKLLQPDKLGKEQSSALISGFTDQLRLTPDQELKYVGKRYIVLIQIDDIQSVDPFLINPEKTDNSEDWMMIRNISRAKL